MTYPRPPTTLTGFLRPIRWAVFVNALLSACGPMASAADLKVVVTIKPIHALVAQVMGSTGTPELIVGGAASPHSYTLKPSDIQKMAAATVVFRVSGQVEPFTTKAARTLPKSTLLVTLQQAPGVVTLPQREGGPFEEHEHDHDGGGHANSEAEIDGHVWLDPANAVAMVDHIVSVLSSKSPENAAIYADNAAVARARLDALSADLSRDLAGIGGRPYVVFHDAYQYFEKRFGLKVVGSITVNPDVPPSGKRLAALRQKVSRLQATCVFGEPNFSAKVITSVIEGTDAKSGTLDPEGASLAAGPDLYDVLMRNLATALQQCLQPRV